MGHLDGRQSRFKSFVAALQPGAIDGLLERVACQHAKNDGHAGVQLRELQAARSLRADIIVVGGFAPNHAADGHERVVLRSEEHTSELQSLAYLVCRLLLEKK